MEEMMKKSTEAMGNNQNGVVDKLKVDADLMEIDNVMMEDDVALEVINFSRRFPKCIEAHLQKDWPMVTSALKQYGFSCELDLVKSSMTFSTTRTIDPDIVDKARDLLQLLSLAVPASMAIRILNRNDWDIIKFGCQKDGLCSKFGITREQFFERRNLLSHPSLKEIGDLIWCDIFMVGDILVVVGPINSLKWVRTIVEDCIAHKIIPGVRIKFIKEAIMLVVEERRLEALRL